MISDRAHVDRPQAELRWRAAVGGVTHVSFDVWAEQFAHAGRLTLNFHPDRLTRSGQPVATALLRDGRYRCQWITGLSAGSRSAVPGGDRERFERQMFQHAYTDADPNVVEHPVYGALDLLFDDHGGSPRFGSSFAVLGAHVLDRTTLCLGDSHLGPRDVGTANAPWSILAGLAEQAVDNQLLNRGLGVDALLGSVSGSFRLSGPSRDLDGYVEAQVHGGVSLQDDVDAIVLDPSFRGTPVERDLAEAGRAYGFELAWHRGSELTVGSVPDDFRGPSMPALAKRVARPDGVVDARAIGVAAAQITFEDAKPSGDSPENELNQVKYLWHTLLAFGHDAS